ncbi:TPA: DUF4931 domain-containing protein [Candidatus Woesearchaeota archaeon]|nr:DUF4931 domain-containing protein [Candidatus Woesearchaeota archaeon]HIH54231.1 DUF4931 domain-containing protein [Candidatus Woesearchaeota archaeon]HIJ02632.1 DUF4931 domain-containing protein [Candidatus Woesearchaeota archaeon]
MEIRKDYILDSYTIIAENRSKRPNEFKRNDDNGSIAKCDFCPGNEQMTLPGIGHLGSPWNMRWFPNKYPLADCNDRQSISINDKYFKSIYPYGFHEVIVETNDHSKQLFDFNIEELKVLLDVYCDRIRDLSSKEKIEYVLVLKNHGINAGTSLQHSHSQILALNHVPELITRELNAVNNYDNCPYCEIIEIEKNSPRYCYENEGFIALTPYAPRFNYELWILAKKHILSITQLNDSEKHQLAEILQKALIKLKSLDVSFNLLLINSPEGFIKNMPEGQKQGLHFRIMITPKTNIRAGLEESFDLYVDTTTPETAAEFYR